MDKTTRFPRSNAFSLIEVVIALTLVGAALFLLANVLMSQLRGQKKIELRFDRAAIVRVLNENLSCAQTVRTNFPTPAALTAANNQLVALYDRQGNVLVSANPAAPTVIGRFTVRARAHTIAAPLGFEIEVAKPRSGLPNPLADGLPDAAFESDPVLKTLVLRWGGPQSRLFPAGSFPCATQFVTGCIQRCPQGSVTTGIDPDTHCVSCADIQCPAGQYFRGLSATNTKICETPASDCPANQVRVGTDCVDFASGAANSITERVRLHSRVQCRLVSSLTPTSTPITDSCAADEFLANAGARCTNAAGNALFGLVAGNMRFPGYMHTFWPTDANTHVADCYGVPGDPPQGHVSTRAVCCKLKLEYVP